uniref:Uncharacterized protein n=1 Tax=Arcella intermedia TaxID=1963864 RepID=A0A6B2LSQ4_9EUKA
MESILGRPIPAWASGKTTGWGSLPTSKGTGQRPLTLHDNERMIGGASKNQTNINPANTVFDAKRLIVRFPLCHW